MNSLKNLLSEKVTLILDRDGVLNKISQKSKYINDVNELDLNSEIINRIKLQNKSIEKIVIFTNQPWINSAKDGSLKHKKIKEFFIKLFSDLNIKIFYLFCPHSFEERCECRKPKIGNIIKLLQYEPFLRRKIIFIGDSYADKQAAELIGGVAFFGIKSNKFSNEIINFETNNKEIMWKDWKVNKNLSLLKSSFSK